MCEHETHDHPEPEEASVPAPADEAGPFDEEPQPGDPYTYPEAAPEVDDALTRTRLEALARTTLDVAESGEYLLLSIAAVHWIAEVGEQVYQEYLNAEAARRGVDPHGLLIRTAVQFPDGQVYGLATDGMLYPLGPGDVDIAYEEGEAA